MNKLKTSLRCKPTVTLYQDQAAYTQHTKISHCRPPLVYHLRHKQTHTDQNVSTKHHFQEIANIQAIDMTHCSTPLVLCAQDVVRLTGNSHVLFLHGDENNRVELQQATQYSSTLINQVIFHLFKMGCTTLLIEGKIETRITD